MLRICRRNHRTQCLGHTEGKRQLCPAVLGGLLPLSDSGGHLLRTGCLPHPCLLPCDEPRHADLCVSSNPGSREAATWAMCPGKGPSTTGQVLWVKVVSDRFVCTSCPQRSGACFHRWGEQLPLGVCFAGQREGRSRT